MIPYNTICAARFLPAGRAEAAHPRVVDGYPILYYTVLYCTIVYHTILYYTIPYYTILYYTILYYAILYYTILYCTTIRHMELLARPEACSFMGNPLLWSRDCECCAPPVEGCEKAMHMYMCVYIYIYIIMYIMLY